ncbi:MAG: hypothetical protein KDE19_05030, partial [Caldilineaceae bacterium]|nr:hypothetical protein [Caldilineaceae bacterium]
MPRLPRILPSLLILALLVLLSGCRPANRMARHFWQHHMQEFHADDPAFAEGEHPMPGGTIPRDTDGTTTIEIYHFSDYHSHALPDFAEGDPSRGGIARVVGLLETVKATGDNVLAFNGGDTMNLSNPIWSDEYTCTEWSWFNGIVDGMALGNHELDYGPEVFTDCANTITYPIISSGLVYSATMEAVLPEYHVYEVDGVRIGVFAVVGDDYPGIVRAELTPPGTRWLTGDEKLARAAEIVTHLREE